MCPQHKGFQNRGATILGGFSRCPVSAGPTGHLPFCYLEEDTQTEEWKWMDHKKMPRMHGHARMPESYTKEASGRAGLLCLRFRRCFGLLLVRRYEATVPWSNGP